MSEGTDKAMGNELGELFAAADQVGKKRYHRLTLEDFEQYRAYERWRYVDGDYELGTTQVSKQWVWDHADHTCPICDDYFSSRGGKTIDHKLPRAQYPWWSMDFRNFWVICRECNKEKAEMHWYEYEAYIVKHYPQRYLDIKLARPMALLKELFS
jgi:hypothetical protein